MDTANAIGWRVPFTSFTWKLAASVFVAVAALLCKIAVTIRRPVY